MSQNPIVLPTTGTVSGLQLVQDANAALDTLNTKWAGSSPPPSPEPYQDWLDTSTSPPTLRIYDGAEWVAVAQIDTTNHVFLPVGLIPIGMVAPFAGAVAPAGWVLCYGQAISRTSYAALFAVVGTTYGVGDGSTTFNVPDMRGRVAAGADAMGGTAANRLGSGDTGGVTGSATVGATGGEQSHTLSTDEMPAHTHNTDGESANDTASEISGSGAFSRYHTTTTATSSAGGGDAHNNVQPTLVLNYIIKT